MAARALFFVLSTSFTVAGLFTAWQSAKVVGTGVWGGLIAGVALFVFAAQFIVPLRAPVRVLAVAMAVLAVVAVVLGTLAATVGGSFRLSTESGLLLLGFAGLAVTGGALGFIGAGRRGPRG